MQNLGSHPNFSDCWERLIWSISSKLTDFKHRKWLQSIGRRIVHLLDPQHCLLREELMLESLIGRGTLDQTKELTENAEFGVSPKFVGLLITIETARKLLPVVKSTETPLERENKNLGSRPNFRIANSESCRNTRKPISPKLTDIKLKK